MKKPLFLAALHLKDYRVLASIGCTLSERQKKQEISFEVLIRFNKTPEACMTDNLSGSYCYAKMAALIKKVSIEKHYELIEHLGYCVYQALKKTLSLEEKLEIKLNKLNPPIADLKGGVVFSYGDED